MLADVGKCIASLKLFFNRTVCESHIQITLCHYVVNSAKKLYHLVSYRLYTGANRKKILQLVIQSIYLENNVNK